MKLLFFYNILKITGKFTFDKGKLLKRTFVLLLILGCCLGAFCQDETTAENKVAIGIGPEWNMDSRYNFAMGGVFSFDANLPKSLALGLSVTGSYNFNGITVIEPAALFRWYFMGHGLHTGFFLQADLGAFLIFEDGDLTPMFLGGLRGGYRFNLTPLFYVEPYCRLGYPFAFGIGAVAGLAMK